MARPQKYKSDDERIKAHRAQQTSYGRKIWECDICGCKLQLGNKSNHVKSEKHAKNSARGDEKGVSECIDTLI
jgi:ribosomal protein L37AE/L43A